MIGLHYRCKQCLCDGRLLHGKPIHGVWQIHKKVVLLIFSIYGKKRNCPVCKQRHLTVWCGSCTKQRQKPWVRMHWCMPSQCCHSCGWHYKQPVFPIAPFCPNRPWFHLSLTLLTRPPYPLPNRPDLLPQMNRVTFAQQTTHLEIMDMAPGSNHSILGCTQRARQTSENVFSELTRSVSFYPILEEYMAALASYRVQIDYFSLGVS